MNTGIKDIFLRYEKWLEVVVITGLAFLLCRFISPDDPLYLKGPFPWPWIAPLVLSLRYGISAGMTSAFLLVAPLVLPVLQGNQTYRLPTAYVLGGLLMVLLSGQFSSVWNKRLRRSDILGRHAGERFEQLSKAYFMVRLSHDRLEQNLVSRPVTLRGAMEELRKLLVREGGGLSKESSRGLLAILVHYCRIGSAAIYSCRDGAATTEILASCGRGSEMQSDDLLLRAAMESGNTAYQAVNTLEPDKSSSYLVVAPIRTSSGEILGVLLIEEMPFLALERETLQIMAVILSYFADHSGASESAYDIISLFPDCPTMFAAELVKMARLSRDLDIVSAVSMIEIPPLSHQTEISMALERLQRGLDHSWRRDVGDMVQIFTLMPFSGTAGIEGYLTRISDYLMYNYTLSFKEDGLRFRSRLISSDETPDRILVELIKGGSG